MNCKKDFAPNCNQVDWYHNATIGCTCPATKTGIACQIDTPAACPPQPPPALFFDNSWLNVEENGKQAQCQVEDTPDVDYYGLHDNRVHVVFDAKNASFSFSMMSRIRWIGPDPHVCTVALVLPSYLPSMSTLLILTCVYAFIG
jgi:hypothetical protein